MPSTPLKHPNELARFTTPGHSGHLTVFFNTPAKTNEYLFVVFGTNSFGGVGELAHLRLDEAVFQALAEANPLTTAVGLTRSPDIDVATAKTLLAYHWPPPAEQGEVPAG
jgi:hypothetical protein